METSYQENYTKQLQRLFAAVNKSKKKYFEASNDIESPELKNFFNHSISERQTISSELKTEIKQLGCDVVDADNTIEVNSHHFNSTKSGTASNHDQTVLESIRNSEQEVLDAYDDVLQGSILEEFRLKTVLASHRLIISEAFTHLDKVYFSLFKSKESY